MECKPTEPNIKTSNNVGIVPENREAFSGSSEDDAGRPVHGQRREHLQDHHKTDHRDSGEGVQRLQVMSVDQVVTGSG